MSSTRIISCIDSALHDVEFLFKTFPPFGLRFEWLKLLLNKLKTFVVLSVAKLNNHDANFVSFLRNIEDTVVENAGELHRCCLHLEVDPNDLPFQMVEIFEHGISSLEKEIDEWYVKMMDFRLRESSNNSPVSTEEISTIIHSDLEILRFMCKVEDLEEAAEALVEQMGFLQSFIRFVANPSQDLLAHSEAVAIDVHLLFYCPKAFEQLKLDGEHLDKGKCKEILLTYVRKIKPNDNPHVYVIYTQALISKKSLSQTDHQDMADEDFVTAKNFFDSLVSCLWEILLLNSSDHVVSMKDELKQFYEGLRSLRAILNKHRHHQVYNFEADMVSVLCDAGVFIFSFCQTHTESDLRFLHELLQKIYIVLAKVGEGDPELQMCNFPKTNQLGFVDFVLDKLIEVKSCRTESISKIQDVQTIHDGLVAFRSFLEDIRPLCYQQKELQSLWDRVMELAYRVESLIDHLFVADYQHTSPASIHSIMEDIMNMKLEIKDKRPEFEGKRQEIKVKEATRDYSYAPPQTTLSKTTNEVVGFDDYAVSIIDELARGSTHLRVVAIVGMPGIGKTTLATKVYKDISVSQHFHLRAWCTISQVVHKKYVFLQLLNQIDPDSNFSMLNEQDLVETFWRRLKGKRYLILLDDIWDHEAWNTLAGSFPDDNIGSRLILTSRCDNVAPSQMLVDQKPHFLQPLDEKESFDLLQGKLLHGNVSWNPGLSDLVMQIATSCKGLPLTIVIVAGLLSTIEPNGWEKIRNDLSSSGACIIEHCMNTLELSYAHLADDLRPCFLYLAAFPEDVQISAKRLLHLWMAEGFVRKVKGKRIEDVAEDYLNTLVGKSLIMVAKRRWDGGVKTCRVHDLLHDFCLQKVQDEQFFHVLKGYDELSAFNEPRNLRRLCIHSEQQEFNEAKLFCPRARSLLFNSSGTQELQSTSLWLHSFKLLRVLDLEKIYIRSGFPSEIEVLVQLAFLAIRGHFRHIPSLIDQLPNLETLILISGFDYLLLPDSIWNLQRLKYLHLRSSQHDGGGILSINNLDSFSILPELDRFSGAVIPSWSSMETLMRKFPNIRKLKCYMCRNQEDNIPGNFDGIVSLDFLNQLESLHLSSRSPPTNFELRLPTHLKKLSLSNFVLSLRNISLIGELPNLRVLKLVQICFAGNTWEIGEGEFCKLKILKLLQPKGLITWRACDDQFDCLQELTLAGGVNLKEMPSCLEYIPMLETISLFWPSKTVVDLVKKIQKEQLDWGNSNLKVSIEGWD
ncbi:OLC1v1004380C1 [Oldenlandia corymbosa var. corymbosa]|uniref:OLC1v1004380C1 n=1 Tax=Oldenlandia corymbosa var. corymbosa TaxID=529605 RepID=A0AAV1DCW5_OLDCO|nr:OLC1v1004380C1 [Oldenlandia corymbosa var. corymbosa]